MLELDTARALITTSLSDDALGEVIAREEAWLARRIGPLEGSRVELFVSTAGNERLLLARPADSAAVDDGIGAVEEFDLRGWGDVVRTAGAWSGEVGVTYVPSDESDVISALITLVRLRLSERAFTSESAQGYSYSVSNVEQRSARVGVARSLMRPRQPLSLLLRSGLHRNPGAIHGIAVTSGS